MEKESNKVKHRPPFSVRHYIVEQPATLVPLVESSWCGGWEGVCYIDDLDYCFDIAMGNKKHPAIQGKYSELIKAGGKIINKYFWVKTKAPGHFPYFYANLYDTHCDEE